MDVYRWLVILCSALIPTIIYTIYIRNIELYEREKWRWISVSYLWGAVIALPFLYILARMFSDQFLREHEYYEFNSTVGIVILICLVLPFVSELIKMIGIFTVRSQVGEVEDGLIYGATIGLGFAAIANIFYMNQGFEWDLKTLALLIIPSISTALLHASSSAVAGYGISKRMVEGENLSMITYFFAGVLIHVLFNVLSLTSLIFKDVLGYTYHILGIVIILVVSSLVFRMIRGRMHKLIKILDEETEKERRKGQREW
ncbi:MAG: PrsW family glutamic-type intramembrane protease [Thermoplasmata archaeon]